MLLDAASQHLIAFTPKGTSFIVTNTTDFSRDVLPKYFKHSNFSSFVRQLNMYSFSKINKTPRGVARGSIDNQEWEFRHPKFVRGKPQQLDEIKRK
ncbi:winged helix DNA-binding domain-containing protein, partial [Meredithblackwellia eburnea MCA 4105]